jgi:hypothetical protein
MGMIDADTGSGGTWQAGYLRIAKDECPVPAPIILPVWEI